MSVQLIAENILESGDFSSATEQEGEYIGQPIPASANTGDFRLLTKGDIADFTYSGTATGDGSTTTIVDSVLCAFGDDYFIGGTITFTDSGNSPVGNTSGSKTITDFAQATGTLTWAGALTSTIEGDTFTLTMPFDTRDFRVALIGSGDSGDATFKWSHDGGTTYFGRDDPNQADWLAETEIASDASDGWATPSIQQLANGNLIAIYSDSATADMYCKISTDKGLTWGSKIYIHTSSSDVFSLVLSNGRILVWPSHGLYAASYSDDNGQTWIASSATAPGSSCYSAIELPNGSIIMTKLRAVDIVSIIISNDGGFNWSSPIDVHDTGGGGNLGTPYITRALNGDLIVAYASEEDAADDWEIKCKISSDGGATWGSEIDLMDIDTDSPGGDDLYYPFLLTDIDGTIFCAIERNSSPARIIYTTSNDNGETWAAQADLKSVVATDLQAPCLMLMDGHEILCAYKDETNDDIDFVRRGMWETYSANACPCAIEAKPQHLICDAHLVWQGGAGDAGDNWQFEAKYDYSMANLIQDSPSKPWRSTQDNISCQIVLDIGTNERHLVDGVAFFRCNLRTFDFELDTSSTFTPDDSATVSFDLCTGTVDDVTGNAVKDTSLMANYRDHELAGRYYLRMTSGTDDGVTWEIKDNVGDWIFLDTTAATNIAAAASPPDTFVIFQKHMAATISTTTPYCYMQIDIAAQHTAEDYYQIGTMVAGKTITLTDGWRIEYGKTHQYDIEMMRTPHYGLLPIRGAGRRRIFDLEWPATDTTTEEVMSLLDYIEGKNIVLIPDSSNKADCYLVKLVSDVNLRHWISNKFVMSLTFEEVL